MEDYKKELRSLANENIRLNTTNAILTLENKQLTEQLALYGVGVTLVCEECKEQKELKYCEDCYHEACGAM